MHNYMQLIRSGQLKQVWLRASVVGTIWASFEIIFGSFLHNLKIPISGTILSFIGVWILVAFQQFWKDRGLVWRAGLICALMKSISPSAIILGPMIGIFTESVIIELFIRILGRNYLAYIFGGSLAVLSTLIQKIINLIILYGFDLIKILDGLYKFIVKQIGMENVSPVYLLIIITSLYLIAGAIGATGGYLTGRKYLKQKTLPAKEELITLQQGNNLLGKTTSEKYSVLLLFINITAIISILFLLNLDLLIPAGIIALLYTAFCIATYRNSLRRLMKPGFWISFLLITFGAAFIWNRLSDRVFFTTEGLLIGLKMNARAAVMVIGFASISVELKNPVIKSVLYNRGFSSLYQSLSLSFSALPYLISTLTTNNKSSKIKGYSSLRSILKQADDLYSTFEDEYRKKPSVVIITGEVHEGKTTFTGNVVEILKERKLTAYGFLSIAINEEGRRKGFRLLNLQTGEENELCMDTETGESFRFGRYYFRKEAINKGLKLLSDLPDDCKYVVIDEIGPLELSGGGWSSAIDHLCRKGISPQVWVVRKSVVEKAIRRWNTGDVYIFDISEDTHGKAAEIIAGLVRK
ncbi:MAG: nucleoside-triphosphatase [Bacteroidales bacterium]